jgi:hypothetical protein
MKSRVIRSHEEVPEDYLDFVCLGNNPEEYTVAEFFETQGQLPECPKVALGHRTLQEYTLRTTLRPVEGPNGQ